MPCCRYICCPCLLCCDSSTKNSDNAQDPKAENLTSATAYLSAEEQAAAAEYAANPQYQQDYEDLQYLAKKRAVKVTIRKSTQAGVAAGLSVLAGTLIAGPVGAVAGGAVGTALAASITKNIVPLNDLLEQTPPEKRGEVIQIFNESFNEEFMDTIQNSPELKLLLSGHSPLGVVRYMVDRDLIRSDKLEKLDGIMKKVI